MKTNYLANIFVILVVGGVFSFTSLSCNKTTNSASTGTFYIHLHSNIDTNEVADTTAFYRDATGRHFSLNTARFYISGIMLQNANGTMYSMTNVVVLKYIDSETYLMGTAPIGTYTSIMFNVGLDAATNVLNPTGLNPIGGMPSSYMWYGNTSQGYMFMKLTGSADTSVAQNGINPVPFSYEIGGSNNLKQVSLPVRGNNNAFKPYILTSGQTQYVHLICDYGALLSVINFKTQDSTDSYTIYPAIANIIANNIPNMFHYEE